MSNFKKCVFLDAEKAKAISGWILNKMKSGVQSPVQMYTDFYTYISGKVTAQEEIVFLNSFGKIYTNTVNRLKTLRGDERSSFVSGTNINDIYAIDQALDSADNIDAFIQYNFIEKNLPDLLKKKPEPPVEEDLNTVTQKLPEVNPDAPTEEEKETAKRAEEKVLSNQADFEIQQERDRLKAENEELKANARLNLKVLMPDGSNLDSFKQMAIKNGLIAMVDLNSTDVSLRYFSFDEESGTFHEYFNDQLLNSFPENKFLENFSGRQFFPKLSIETRIRLKSVRTKAQKEAFLEFAAAEFKADDVMNVFSNSFSQQQRTQDLYTIQPSGQIKAGPLAEVIKTKNQTLKLIRSVFGNSKDYRSIGGLVKNTFKGANVVLELSDDKSIGEEVINVVLVKKSGDRVVLGNFMYVLDRSLMKGVAGGQDYMNHLKEIAQKIKDNNGSLDITNSDYKISDPYLPGQHFRKENKIYPQDQYRLGDNADESKAQKLTFKQGLKLLEEMGYGVSKPYIDKYADSEGTGASRAVFSGSAVIAYSPFLSSAEIDSIIQKETADQSANFDFETFSKVHNISFIGLRRKDLSFEDYVKLVKDNDTLFNRKSASSADETEIKDSGKKNALFNFGQSFYLHYRLAKGIPYLEERLKKLKGEERNIAEINLWRYKAMLFSSKDRYSSSATIESDKNYMKIFSENFKVLEQEDGKIVLFANDEIKRSIEANYQKFISAGTVDKQIQQSEYFAAHLFGYASNDPSSWTFDKKKKFAENFSQGDENLYREAMRKGGIYENEVISMIRELNEIPASTKINGQSFSEFWKDTTGGKGINIKAMPMPTFNPVHATKEQGRFSNAKIGELSPLNQWSTKGDKITSLDVSSEYMEMEYMPMMPHFKFSFSGSLSSRKDSTVKKSVVDQKALNFFDKRISQNEFEGFSYELSEDGAKEIYESLLGEIKGDLQFMNSPIEIAEEIVVGRVGKQVMQLHSRNGKISEKVLRHEIMHRVVNEAITPESRKKLYSEVKLKMVSESNGSILEASEISDREADERLAEMYEETYGQYQNKVLKALPKVVADFFLFIKRFFDKIRGKESLFRELAVKLESGYFINNGLNYDGYNGQMLNKAVVQSETLAKLFSNDLQAGIDQVERMKGMIISSVQDYMYGEQVNLNIVENLIPMGYKQAIERGKSGIFNGLFPFYNALTEKEKELFKKNDLFDPNTINNDFLDKIKEQAWVSSRETNRLFKALVVYLNYEDLALKAMPFTKDSKYHYDVDSLLEEEVESHDKMRSAFEKSEMSAYSTFSERVRFFLYNTKVDGGNSAFGSENVQRQHVDAFFVKVQERAAKNIQDINGISTGLLIDAMKQEVESLSVYPDSIQYKSAKAIYDRFFNMEKDANGNLVAPNSFINIANNNSPEFRFQSKSHQSVVNSIISAQKSVVTQEFLQVESTRFGISLKETTESESKKYKNKVNDNIAKKLFVKTNHAEKVSWRLSPEAKKIFFDKSSKYNLAMNDKGEMVVNLFGKSFVYPKSQSSKGQKTDLAASFVTQLTKGLTTDEIQSLMNDIGVVISFDALNKLNQTEGKKSEVVKTAVHSFLVLARQLSVESPNYFPESLKKAIEFTTVGRTDDINKILKENTRFVSASNEDISKVDTEEEVSEKVYSPTTFHKVFQMIGAAHELNAYDSRDNSVYILEGSKENKDKFPNYLHRALSNLSKIKGYSEFKALGSEMNVDDYRDQEFSAIHSSTYRNAIFENDGLIGEMFYFKGIQNKQTQKGKSFNELNDREYTRAILEMMLGKSSISDFHMPMEIQANRGYQPVMKMNHNRRFHVDQNFQTKKHNNELEKIRRIPFHHAGRVMQQVYEIMEVKGYSWAKGKSDQVAGFLKTIKTDKILSEWKTLQGLLEKAYAADPKFLNDLAEKKHYLMIGGKPTLPPLLTERMKFTENPESQNSFVNYFRDIYLEFAESAFSNLSTENKYDIEFKFSKDWFTGEQSSLDLPQFHNLNIKSLSNLFQRDKIIDPSYESLSRDEKIKLYNPALMSAFLTYFINENEIAQALSGDPYLYKADKVTGFNNLHSYMTDYSKRQAGVTTPKIEMTYRETIMDKDFNQVVINKNALSPRLRISHTTDMRWTSEENPEIHALLRQANPLKEKEEEYWFDQDADDGAIRTNMITMKMMQNSMGNENGFRIGTIFKGHGYSFDLKNGHVNYAKGAAQTITPEALEMDEGYLHLILKNQYKHAKISGPGIAPGTDLWTLFVQEKERTGSYKDADSFTTDVYFNARNRENGYALEGDIVNLTAPKATEKGTVLTVNPIKWENGVPSLDKEDSTWVEIGTEGFGAILDLQKDVLNKDNDVSLSTQLVFLLGINGENHKDAVAMYKKIAQLSNAEKEAIADEIYSTLNSSEIERSGIIRNKTALRKWFLKKVNDSYASKGDYGLIYDLTREIGVSSISHPVLFQEIYSNVAAAISKGILMRMNGFKAVQLPSHNTFMTYVDSEGNYYTKKEYEAMSNEDVLGKKVVRRNLAYSTLKGGYLTDTEIFAPNVLAKDFLLKQDKDVSLNGIFMVQSGTEMLNFQSKNGDILNTEKYKVDMIQKVMESEVDWNLSPIVRGMKKILPKEIYRKIKAKEPLTPIEKAGFAELFVSRTIEMNRALYGVISRIPGTGKNSSTPVRIVGFINSYQNTVFAPVEWMLISGSDYDGDTVQFWNYSRNNQLGNEALKTARKILRRKENINEIFSGIDFSFMNKKANEGKKEMLQGGKKKGYVLGSLKTMIEFRSNNSTGTEMTGISATQSKVHSYASMAKTRAMFYLSMKGLDESIGEIVSKKLNVKFVDKQTGAPISGEVLQNTNGDYKDSKGNLVYKWNETLTNAAIDNAKHLFMNFLGLNKVNAGIQQALTAMGVDHETLIERIIKNPIVVQAVNEVVENGDLNNVFSGSLESFIKNKLSKKTEIDENGEEIEEGVEAIVNEMAPTIKKLLKEGADPQTVQEIAVDFTDSNSVYQFLHFLNEINKEMNNVRKTVKVTDKIPGLVADQDYSIKEFFKAVNAKSGSPKLNSVKSLKELLRRIDESPNPFAVKEVALAYANSLTVHPIVVLATMPHLRTYAMRWLEFTEMKEAHLLYSENAQAAMNYTQGNLDFISMRNPRNVQRIMKEMYSFVNGAFLEQEYSDFKFQDKTYNLGNIAEAQMFKEDFAKKIKDLQMAGLSKNNFINKLEFKGSEISFPGSETMDKDLRIPGREGFKELDNTYKIGFMLYEAASSNFFYKKGSIVPFMDKKSFGPYLSFLEKAEKSLVSKQDIIIRDSKDAEIFMDTFMKNNIDLIKKISVGESPLDRRDSRTWFPKSADEIENKWTAESKMLPAKVKIRKEDKRFLKKEEELKEKIEKERGKLLEILDTDPLKEKKITKNSDVHMKINSLQLELSDMLNRSIILPASSGLPPYKIVRYYDKEKGKIEYFLFEITHEESVAEGEAHEIEFKRVFVPIDKSNTLNIYRRDKKIPTVYDKDLMVFTDQEAEEYVQKLGDKIKDGTELYNYQGERYKFHKGEGLKKFSFSSKKGSPGVTSKAKLIASVINQVFPGIKVNLRRNMGGVMADKAGVVHNGEVYLNLDNISIDTPMHEFGHIFIDLLEKADPSMFQKIADLVVQTEEFEEASLKYKQFGNTETDNVKEAFVTLLGYHFEKNFADKLTDLNDLDRGRLIKLVDNFIEKIKDLVRYFFRQANIRKQYIREGIIENLNTSTTLEDMFTLLGGAVLDRKVITDISSKQMTELERVYENRPAKVSESEISRVIDQMMMAGKIVNYCS